MAFNRVDQHKDDTSKVGQKNEAQNNYKYIETDKWASVVGNSKQHAHIQLTVVGKSPSVSTLHSNSK